MAALDLSKLPANARNLLGLRFGRLLVIQLAGRKSRYLAWLCKCDCGNEKVVVSGHLRDGGTQSCGCLKAERSLPNKVKHGQSGSPTYHAWERILARCHNPKTKDFPRYGGRGITVCERWHDFAKFHADMGDIPPGLTIERINNARGYEPNNCRWASHKEQSRNKSSNRIIEFRGERRPVCEWAEITGIKSATIFSRLDIGKWTIEEALTMPLQPRRPMRRP